MKSMIRQTKI